MKVLKYEKQDRSLRRHQNIEVLWTKTIRYFWLKQFVNRNKQSISKRDSRKEFMKRSKTIEHKSVDEDQKSISLLETSDHFRQK